MRLTRNTTPDGRLKYALVRLDKLRKLPLESLIAKDITNALDTLAAHGVLEYGEKGSEEEFFVIKLKDRFAVRALMAYSRAVRETSGPESEWQEYATDVGDLAVRAVEHPKRNRPTP